MDIAVDGAAAPDFDLDNLAAKVIAGFAEAFDWPVGQPTGYRIYRREAEEAGVLVRMRSFDAFRDLERVTGGYTLGLDFQPRRRRVFD